MRTVCVIGLGQIGGSLAWALSEKKNRVIGISRRKETVEKAEKMGIISKGFTEITKEALKESDIVILSTHLGLYSEILKKIRGFEGVVSDVGSVKSKFAKICEKYRFRFAGAHPIAGTEKSGLESANPQMFENKICIISGWSDETSKRIISQIWKDVGSKVIYLEPDEHDELLAFLSHLPHAIAFSVVQASFKARMKNKEVMGGSFKDITRVVASPAEMWADIFAENSKFVSKSISRFISEIKKIQKLIMSKDREKILRYILESKEKI